MTKFLWGQGFSDKIARGPLFCVLFFNLPWGPVSFPTPACIYAAYLRRMRRRYIDDGSSQGLSTRNRIIGLSENLRTECLQGQKETFYRNIVGQYFNYETSITPNSVDQ